jgi:thiamine kinase-like enzyme
MMVLSKQTINNYLKELEAVFDNSKIIQLTNSKNFCFQVKIDTQKGYFLKQSKSNHPIEISIFEREAIFYSWVSKEPDLAIIYPHLPTFYGYDPNHHILIFGLLENTKNIGKYLNSKPLTLSFSQNLGFVFRKFNQITSSIKSPLRKELSHPFFELSNPHFRTELGKKNPLAKTLADDINLNSILSSGIQKATKLWQVNGLMHKDVKFENWLINPKTKDLYLIDWEDASFGDTDWDLACMLRSIILNTLLKDKVILIPRLTPMNPILDNVFLIKQLKAFMNGYNRVFEEIQQEKIVIFLAVSLLQKLVEFAQGGSDMGTRNTQVIRIAEELLNNPAHYQSLVNP